VSFVHLHCHSEYSLLDGANRIEDLIARALEFEQPALAITDHGNMHAAWEFQERAKKAGIKPILGMEAYVAPGDRRSRQRIESTAGGTSKSRAYYHLVLLAQNATGYKNLVKLSSLGYTEGFYSKPRVDRELLARHNEGIVVSSACMAGEVATHLLANNWDAARTTAASRLSSTSACSSLPKSSACRWSRPTTRTFCDTTTTRRTMSCSASDLGRTSRTQTVCT